METDSVVNIRDHHFCWRFSAECFDTIAAVL